MNLQILKQRLKPQLTIIYTWGTTVTRITKIACWKSNKFKTN